MHRAYTQLLASRPDLSKACNGVILYGLCKCDKGTGASVCARMCVCVLTMRSVCVCVCGERRKDTWPWVCCFVASLCC